MNQTIRSRIEQIKRGEIPEGYEKTPFGIFPCDWEKSTLKKLGEFAKGKGIPGEKMKNEGIPCVGYGDIYMKYNYHFNQAKSFIDRTTADESIQVGIDTLLFTGTGETAEEIGKCVCYTGSDDIYVGGDIIIFNSVDVSPVFIAYQQYLPFAIKQKAGFGQGHSVVHIYKSDLEKLYCAYPKSKAEQDKIAEILQEQDRLIELKEKLIEEKKKRKQYLVQQLLTKKLRLPGIFEEWRNITLGECLQEVNLRTTENNQYEALSVTREGIVRQKEQFNFQRASDNNIGYKVIKKNQVAFSVLNLWMGSVDILQSPEIGMISPAYKVFDCISNIIIPDFAKYFLRSAEMVWLYNVNSEIGASIVRKNLDLDGLLQSNVTIPKIPEQRAIAEVLSKADDELDLLQKELEEQKRKKQSLMQLLLTGIVRVKA